MSTTAFSSQGTQLKVAISGTPTLIPYCITVQMPPIKQTFDDITNLDSPSGFPERLSVGKEFVTVSVPMVFDPTNAVHQFLMAAAIAQTNCDFTLVLSDSGNGTSTFSGYVSMEPVADTRKALRNTMTIEVTSAITYTP